RGRRLDQSLCVPGSSTAHRRRDCRGEHHAAPGALFLWRVKGMAQVTFLGTGSALSGPERENTFMLVQGKETNLLIDCAGGPTQRLAAIGISPAAVDHIILTHNHPDHIYGLPLLLLNSWMAGRRTPIHLYGLQATMRSARALLRALDMHELPNFFKIKYHPVVPNSITSLPPIGEFDVKV